MRVVQQEAIAGLYEAAAEGGAMWDASWKAILRAVDAPTGMLFVDLTHSPYCDFLSLHGWTEAASKKYQSYYVNVDPYVIYGKTSLPPPTGAHLSSQIISAQDYAETEIWRDFGRSQTNAFHMIVAQARIGAVGSAKLGLHRPPDDKPFEELERLAIESLLPHLQAALRLRTRLAEERSIAQANRSALDALQRALLILNCQGKVLYANRSAEELARTRVIAFGPHGFGTAYPQANATLRKLISEVASGSPGGSTLIHANGDVFCASVERSPVSIAEALGSINPTRGHYVLVFVKTIVNKGQLAGQQLRSLFNLSPIEVEVSELLANGQSPLQIAEERQVSINTVRTQLRQIFAKTGCSNLSDLVRLLARLSS